MTCGSSEPRERCTWHTLQGRGSKQVDGDSQSRTATGNIRIELAGDVRCGCEQQQRRRRDYIASQCHATVNGRTHNGEVVTDSRLAVSGDGQTGHEHRIGRSAPCLSSTNGDLLKKGSAAPPRRRRLQPSERAPSEEPEDAAGTAGYAVDRQLNA